MDETKLQFHFQRHFKRIMRSELTLKGPEGDHFDPLRSFLDNSRKDGHFSAKF